MIRFLVTSLTKALLHQLLSLASSRKSPGCFKLLPLRVTEITCFCEPPMLQTFFCTLPQICASGAILSQRSTDNSLDFMAWFVLWHALLHVEPYRQVFAFRNHVQSTQFTTGGLQSSCINISRMISGWTGCTWAQFWVSWQRLWILMYMCFFFYKLAKISNKLLSHCNYGVLFLEFCGK